MEMLWASIRWLFRNIYSLIERTADAVGNWLSPPNQSSVFYVSGRYLYDNNHKKVILRGINLMLVDDWDFPGSDKLGELAKSKANAVRIQWYKNYGNAARRPYYNSDLDTFLNRCRENRLIPIVELHDWTGDDYTQTVNDELIEWWTSPDVVAVLRRHERYLIINLANELGRYRFYEPDTPAEQADALGRFKNYYKTAVTAIRDQGLRMPIMIDAPDYGQSINALTSIGKELVEHDPRRSLLLSVHSYWAGYDGRPEIDAAVQADLPIVFGEIANKQEGNNDPCYYDLDGTGENNTPRNGFLYQELLADYLTPNKIGWLAWAWHKDSCAARRMTPDGNYTRRADLTPYGIDILFNRVYGLRSVRNPARRTGSLPGAPPLFPGQIFPGPPPPP